jgi:hypothetical protein
MKKAFFVFALMFFLIGCATQRTGESPAHVQEKMEAPIWGIGDTWRYRYANKIEWQYTVEKTEGNLYIVEDRYGVEKPCFDKRTLELKFFLTPQGKKVTSQTVWYYGIYCDFPIYVGKKWGKMVSGKDTGGMSMDYLHEFKVLSFEEVTVPAGTFKAFKIEFSKTVAARTSSVIRQYFWFSPEVKTIIKSSYAGQEGGWRPGSYDFELISVKLKDKQPSSPEAKLPSKEVDITSKPQSPQPEKPQGFAQKEPVTDKSQVAFQKDSTGYVYLASVVELKSFDTVVIGNFSIEGLPAIGPGRLESYRDSYRYQLKAKLVATGIFKEVTDDQSKASGLKTLVIWGDILTMDPGSAAKRFWIGFGAGKAVAEIKTYLSTGEGNKILLAHHLRPTSHIRGIEVRGETYLQQGVERIATFCVEYIKRVYQTGQ